MLINIRIKLFLVLVVLLACLFIKSEFVLAAESCTVSVSPSSVMTESNTSFSFSLNNTGENTVTTIKIFAPSANFSLLNSPVAGWRVFGNPSSATLIGGSLLAGATLNFSYSAISGSVEAPPADWQVITDTGSGEVTCSGNRSTEIAGVADRTPPIIESITVGDIVDNSVKISWVTNEMANSRVEYGVTGDYGESVEEATMVTNHALTLTGLLANTKYYFGIITSDGSGNITRDDENEFTTAMAGVGTGETVVVTINTTSTRTEVAATSIPTPTLKPLVDTVKPVVSISTDFSKPYLMAPTIEGKAYDGGDVNVGVVGVEYSLDGGKNWLPVDNLEGAGNKSASFEFTPVGLDDGNYLIKMRAKDSSGNVGQSKVYTMVVDRLPPQVGGVLYSLGPMILKPDENGRVMSIAGLEIKVTLGAVGGPVIMDLFYNLEKFSLLKNIESGLWSGVINLLTEGNYKLLVKSIDGAKNETERALNSIVSLKPGKVVDDKGKGIKGAKVKVYVFEKVEGDYVLWDGVPYGQENPQRTNEKGEYKLFLPAGKYFVEVEMAGKKKQRTEIFEIEKPTPMTNNFGLNKVKGFWNFWAEVVPISLGNSGIDNSKKEKIELVGKNLPSFDLSVGEEIFSDVSILGKPTVLTFVSTWEPQTADQLRELEKLVKNNSGINVVAVSVQESVSKTYIFKKVGGYDVKIMADPDGVLVEPLGLESLPRHLFLDRKGIIKESALGFLTEKEMWQKVLE